MSKFQTIIQNFSRGIVYFIFSAICVYLFFISIFSTCVMWYDNEKTYYISDYPFLLMLGITILIFCAAKMKSLFSKILSKHKFIIISASSLWLIMMLIFVLNTPIVLVYDQARVFESITAFVNGDYSPWAQGGYMYDFPFQNGLLFLYLPFMLLFGTEHTYAAIQALNILFFLLLAISSYKLSQKYFNNKIAICTYLCTLYFFPLWGYVKYFYGNLPGLCLITWSMYFYTKYMDTQKWKDILASAICGLFATIFKGNFIIYIIGMILVAMLESLKKKALNYLLTAILLGTIVLWGNQLPSFLIHYYTGATTNQGIPMINCIAMGLRESSTAPGWYNGDSIQFFADNDYSIEKATNSAWDSILQSINLFRQEKAYALRFFSRKTASIWNNPTFEGFAVVVKGNLYGTIDYWMKDILYSGGIINTILTIFLDIIQSFYLFGTLLYLIYCKKEHELKKAIPLIAFIGCFILHIFWEAQGEYTILFFTVLIPYAFVGYQFCINKLSQRCFHGDKLKKILKSKDLHPLLYIIAAIIVISICNHPILESTIKLGGDGGDYIWLCKEQAYWKNEHFTKEGDFE